MPRNDSIEKVLSEYKARIDRFEIKRDSIFSSLYEKYPDLKKLRQRYASLRINERSHKNDAAYCEKFKKIDLEYETLLSECLNKENISPEDLKYHPQCEKCKDTGYVGETIKKYCNCIISKAAENSIKSSNINNRETLDSFDLNLFDDNIDVLNGHTQKQLMKRLYDYIKTWTQEFPNNNKKQILIMGNVGLGKSYCLNSIAYELIKKGYTAMLVSSFAINEAAFDEIKKSDSTALNMMRSVDLLLIDDLGGEQVLNNITCPTLLNILNERTRKDLHTIISTNLNPDMLEEKYGSRVLSRLLDKARTVIPPIKGEDIRKKHPQ